MELNHQLVLAEFNFLQLILESSDFIVIAESQIVFLTEPFGLGLVFCNLAADSINNALSLDYVRFSL